MWDARFNKDKAMKLLRERGAVSAVVEFSGGNDEGGVDSLTVKLADGTEFSPKELYSSYEMVDGKYTEKKPDASPEALAESELHDALSAIVYEKYGSFAGEFYVNGTVEYDVATGTVKYSGNESQMQGEDFSESY